MIWKDPPTIETDIDALRANPGRWALLDVRISNNAASCKASELRRKFRGVEFRVYECEIYARAKG